MTTAAFEPDPDDELLPATHTSFDEAAEADVLEQVLDAGEDDEAYAHDG
jgi:hypothetical protein